MLVVMYMLSIVIPVYNEESRLRQNISKLVNYLSKQRLDYEIIISNDGSNDDTDLLLNEISDKNPLIRLVNNDKNMGRGYALKKTCNLIKGNKVIFMDLDMPSSTNLNIIEDLNKELDDYDVVLGSRFLSNSKTKRRLHRGLISKVYRLLRTLLFPKLKITDTDVGMKSFRGDVFCEVNKYIKSNRWSWDLEFLLESHRRGHSIKEIPIDWKEDKDSTLNIFLASMEQFISLLVFRIRYS
jgi:glycosyltransferase involved in cell wall biosynthesis